MTTLEYNSRDVEFHDFAENQPRPVPQLRPYDGRGQMTKEAAMIRSDLLLGRLVRHHPDKIIFPQDVTVEPTTFVPLQYGPRKRGRVVPIPTESTVSLKAIRELRPTLQMITEVVALFYERTPFDLQSRRQDLVTSRARQVAMWCGRQFTQLSFSDIGRKFSERDHSTIKYGCDRIDSTIEDDERLADEIEVIKLHLFEALTNRSAA